MTSSSSCRPCPAQGSCIAYCESVADYVTRELLEDILESEEEHVDWLETQLGLIKQVGIEKLPAIPDGVISGEPLGEPGGLLCYHPRLP